MVGFIVLKKESTYICATYRKCMNAMKNYTYHLVAVLTVGIWGLTFISTKVLIGHGLSPQEIFLLRFLIAYMGIWLISPRKLFADNWKDEFWMFLGGMTGGSFYFFTENTALEITLATNVSFIVCTAPLLTTILSLWIYKKEKATRGLIGGSLLALVGVALVVYNGSFVLKISPLGDFLTLLAAFSWAFYSLIMRKMSNRYGITFITRKIFFYGVLTILPAFLVHPWQFDIARLLEPAILFNLLFLGVLASLICFVVWNVILKQLGTILQTDLKEQFARTDRRWFDTLLVSLLTPSENDTARYEAIIRIRRDRSKPLLYFDVVNAPFAKVHFENKTSLIRHEINAHFIHYFGGIYKVQTEAEEGPTISFTIPCRD